MSCPITLLTQPNSWDSCAEGFCAESLKSVRVFGVTSLWDQPFEFWDQTGKQVVKKAPGGSLPIFCDLICLPLWVFKFASFLMKSKTDLKESWMVENVYWNKEKSLHDKSLLILKGDWKWIFGKQSRAVFQRSMTFWVVWKTTGISLQLFFFFLLFNTDIFT